MVPFSFGLGPRLFGFQPCSDEINVISEIRLNTRGRNVSVVRWKSLFNGMTWQPSE